MKMQVEHMTENGKINTLELGDEDRSNLVKMMKDGETISMEYVEHIGFTVQKLCLECECFSDYRNTGFIDGNSCEYCIHIYKNSHHN